LQLDDSFPALFSPQDPDIQPSSRSLISHHGKRNSRNNRSNRLHRRQRPAITSPTQLQCPRRRTQHRKTKTLLANPNLKEIENATFTIVPDLLVPNALDQALANSDYAIHLASPIPIHGDIAPEHQHDELVVPAIQATLRVLEAAQVAGTVKRVVITSSAGAIVPPNEILANDEPPVNRFVAVSADDRVADVQPPYASLSEAYCASKIAALNASDQFMRGQKRAFDVVNIMPS
jgi:nucleoside-diphosphate-sugar epimerase